MTQQGLLTPHKPFPPSLTNNNKKPKQPLTPSPTPVKRKRPTVPAEDALSPLTSKKRRRTTTTSTSSDSTSNARNKNKGHTSPSPSTSSTTKTTTRHQRFRFKSPPLFSLLTQHPHSHSDTATENEKEERHTAAIAISWLELDRATESVMRQVDWHEVAADVASNRGAGWYKRVVSGVLREGIAKKWLEGEWERKGKEGTKGGSE